MALALEEQSPVIPQQPMGRSPNPRTVFAAQGLSSAPPAPPASGPVEGGDATYDLGAVMVSSPDSFGEVIGGVFGSGQKAPTLSDKARTLQMAKAGPGAIPGARGPSPFAI